MSDPSQNSSTYGPKKAARSFAIGLIAGFLFTFFQSCRDGESESINFVMALAVGIGFGICAMVGDYFRNRTDNSLKKWCRANGWIWIGDNNPFGRAGCGDFVAPLRKSRLFWRHYDGWNHAVVFDGNGISAAFGNIWHDTDPGGSNGHVKNAGFMVVRYQGECPDTTLEPHHLTDMLPKLDGRTRVEFESESFNKSWRVYSTDAKAAFDRFDQSTIEFLENTKFKPTIEFVGGVLVLKLNHSKMYQDAYREKVIRWMEDFSAAVPDDLVKPMKMLSTRS